MHSSRFSRGTDRSHVTASVTTPTVCPACQSAAIATTARNPDEHAYWRCSGCGDLERRSQSRVQRRHSMAVSTHDFESVLEELIAALDR
jgi:hypothetical protein